MRDLRRVRGGSRWRWTRFRRPRRKASQIRGAQIHAIVRLTPVVMTASGLNALISLAVLAATETLSPEHCIWALALLALAPDYLRGRLGRGRRRERPASRRAIRRAIANGARPRRDLGRRPGRLVRRRPDPGAALRAPASPPGMMSGGAFVLATVPLAAMSYVG
jgi:hypothetical protein